MALNFAVMTRKRRQENTMTVTNELTAEHLEATLQRYFAEADKQSMERFGQLETQMDAFKLILDKNTKELKSL